MTPGDTSHPHHTENATGNITSEPPSCTTEQAISRLPVELLTTIFLACLPPDDYIVPKSSEAPMLLGQVNNTWRGVALSTPELWCSIFITRFTKREVDAHPHASLVELWLSRSASLPLWVSFLPGDLEDCLTDRTAFPQSYRILDLIVANYPRWKSVCLFWPDFDRTILKLVDTPNNHLERMVLFVPSWTPFEVSRRSQYLLGDAPNLKEFVLACRLPLPRPPIKYLGIPFHQLTVLDIQIALSTKRALAILSRCQRLIECRFAKVYYPPHDVHLQPITLRHLKSLTLSCCWLLPPFFDLLTLPSLQTLCLYFGNYTVPNWPQPSFMAFISRSRCSITHLDIQNAMMTEEDLVDILHITSHTLVHLRLHQGTRAERISRCISNKVIQLLTFPEQISAAGSGLSLTEGCGFLCPYLETIDLDRLLMNVSPEVLIDMIVSRCNEPALDTGVLTSLKRVRLEATMFDRDQMKQLKALRKGGLVQDWVTRTVNRHNL